MSAKDVREFCARYHYTGTGNNANWRWGLWHGVVLLGVVAYNMPTRAVAQSVFGPEHAPRIWHMTRLAMTDEAPRNSESRLIGGSLRLIQAQRPDVWAVLTYAATDAGHIGYVYQATNATYLGVKKDNPHPIYYVDAEGRRRGSHLNGRWVNPQRAEELGWTPRRGGLKHRYVYILGNRAERKHRRVLLRLPPLPYPKGDDAS